LQLEERDALKYTLALLGARRLLDTFDLPVEDSALEEFYLPLRHIASLQPFSHRVPPYGIAYIGRPSFVTDHLLGSLREEAALYRPHARPLSVNDHLQYLYQPDEPKGELLSEQLAESEDVKALVEAHVGPVARSYVTNYIYYDRVGQCSKPHIDNYFT